MFFELLGYVLSSVIIAIIIAFKFTTDIYPSVLKRLLNRVALVNWINGLPKRFETKTIDVPKCTEDLAIFASKEERSVEHPLASLKTNELDDLLFYGIDDNGNVIAAQITRSSDNKSDALLYILINGIKYSTFLDGVSSNSNEFSCGNFKLELVEPMRTWRLWYNGALEHEKTGGLVHGTMNFLWKALENPTDSRNDVNVNLLSQYLSQNGSFGQNLPQLRTILAEGYSQFGTLHGIIKIDDIEIPPLYLYGFRTRRFTFSCPSSPSPSSKSPANSLELFGMSGVDGNAFKLEALNDGWIDGMMYYPSYQVNPILNVNEADASHFFSEHSLPKLFCIDDKVKAFRIEIWPRSEIQKFDCLEITSLKLNINGKSGRGLLVRRKFDTFSKNLRNPRESISVCLAGQASGAEAVRFDSNLCLNVSLVGGKAASLAKLARIAEIKDVEYKTARAFCLTTTLFSSALDLDKMKNIFGAAKTDVELEQACSEVVDLIKTSKTDERIRSAIEPLINEQFGSDKKSNKNLRFAVRSSGVLEDGSDISSAGQNETFLGITEDSIPEKVLECWASLFAPQSVLYRLNHGQPAMSEMAVVIQEMVDAQAAGVIFSADPRTGNPFEMILNGNFGLGESVVSATCDPDNITIIRPRHDSRKVPINNNKEIRGFSIGKKVLGEKKLKIELSQDGKSTEEVSVLEDEAKKFCVDDDTILKLAKIVVRIEQELGDLRPIDVEWAIHRDGTIYILQSRNITALDSWTEFEIIHEMDSPLRTTFERHTTANTGEVMPGASSPLSISVVTRVLDISIQRRTNASFNEPIVPYMLRSCGLARQRVLLNIINLMYKTNQKEIGAEQVALDLSVFGHRVITDELHRIGIERYGLASGLKKITGLLSVAKGVWKTQKEVIRIDRKYTNYTIDLNTIGDDSKSIFEFASQKLFDLYDITQVHCGMSEASTVTQMFAFLTLANGKHVDSWDALLYDDVSKILAVSTDVESADVPTSMDELASVIISEGESLDAFTETTTVDGLHWLRLNPKISLALDKFFEKHGHRCISELDLSRKSWKADPTEFIKLLQSIVRNKVKAKDTWKSSAKASKFANDDELLASLKTQLSSGSKRFLKFILYYCRRAVINRERTKSLLVWTVNQMKPIYDILAKKMKEEHLIPDEKLIRFMTHEEIGLIVSGHFSNSRIIYKALRRLKMYPALNKEQFPEISVGMIEPLNQDANLELGDSIQATPLSSGKVQATVKVCLNVEEAAQQLEPGDILVTIGTDIGWSPFFPMLGGIVTELGGLISHGAVVAREYGLPCIVGATNATKIFKSGEQVILDAGKGTLTKVKT